jgi:hypothetical protein
MAAIAEVELAFGVIVFAIGDAVRVDQLATERELTQADGSSSFASCCPSWTMRRVNS